MRYGIPALVVWLCWATALPVVGNDDILFLAERDVKAPKLAPQSAAPLPQGSAVCQEGSLPSCGPCFSGEKGCGCATESGISMGCDDCPPYGLTASFGVESFRGISDGSFQSNFGVVTGVNGGIPVLPERGIGWQLGMSYGVYDFDGRSSVLVRNSTVQQQTFVTTGFFRKADDNRRLSYGLVYDWMINDNWGIYGLAPTLGQWRTQIEWALNQQNGVGVWGTWQDRDVTQLAPGGVPTTVRGLSQVNVFWHHKFEQGADGRLWIGVPERSRLTGNGTLGEWVAGGQIEVPVRCDLAFYGLAEYMKPSASAGLVGAIENSYDISVGIVWYPGRNAASRSLNGGCWTPYMPVGNNANFLVDQSRSF